MRIYLASTGSGMHKKTREQVMKDTPPLYILETFFNGPKACEEAMRIVGNENFLLDSGAFSYMNGAKVSFEQMDLYVNKYIEFIVTHDVKYFIEIDVDNIFGLPQVEVWRRRIEEAAGRQCIPVWHKGRGVEYWKQMCRQYSYVAIGGLVFHVKKQEYGLIRQLVQYARYHGVKVHGLGFTKTKLLPDFQFYSVDSASWTVGAALGQQRYTFDMGELTFHHIQGHGRKTDLNKLTAHNLREWVKYQKYMDGVQW